MHYYQFISSFSFNIYVFIIYYFVIYPVNVLALGSVLNALALRSQLLIYQSCMQLFSGTVRLNL